MLRNRVDGFLFDRNHNPWAGFAAMAISIGLSIWLFANQTDYVGVVPKHHPAFGDLTFEVGFVLAALLYALFFRLQGESKRQEVLDSPVRRRRRGAAVAGLAESMPQGRRSRSAGRAPSASAGGGRRWSGQARLSADGQKIRPPSPATSSKSKGARLWDPRKYRTRNRSDR